MLKVELLASLWMESLIQIFKEYMIMKSCQKGFTLAAILVALSIMMIMWALALPVWEKLNQREKELELIWRGNQIQKAIGRYFFKFGTYPPNLDILVEKKFLRKKYKDPIWKDGEWETLHQITSKRAEDGSVITNVGPIIGVISQSKEESIIWYQNLHHHNEWRFVFYPRGASAQQPPQQPVPKISR